MPTKHDHVYISAKAIVARAHFLARSEIDGLREKLAVTRPREEIACFGDSLARAHLDGLRFMAGKLQSQPEYDAERVDLQNYAADRYATLLPLVATFEAAGDDAFAQAKADLMLWCQETQAGLAQRATALDNAAELLPAP